MRDRSLTTLKFTVIFLNIILILGFMVFSVLSVKFVTKSKCENFNFLVDDTKNVKISFDQNKMFVVEKKGDELYGSVLNNCDGKLINQIRVSNNDK